MARPTISRNIDQVAVLSSPGSASAPAPQVRDQNFPTGDKGLRSILLRYDATISGTSTPVRVNNGHIFYLNGLTVETDKHGKMVDNVDGLLLYIYNIYTYNTTGLATALTSTPTDNDTPSATYIVPFSLYHGLRPYDTLLDMEKARMKVTSVYGAVTNLWTQAGGTPLVVTNTQSIESKELPGPLVDGGPNSELPVWIKTFEQSQIPITATQTRFQIALPFGDRIWNSLFLTQRNTSTKVEMSNVIAATANVSLYVNGVPIIDRRRFCDIQSENKSKYNLESLPTGVAVLDFDDDTQQRTQDMLWTLDLNSGNMYLYIDVTTQTNASLLLGYDCLKPIPAAAQRSSQQAAS